MKVCFLAGTLGRGGAERQLLFMLRALQCEGIETKLLCLTSGEQYEQEIAKLGIDVEWVGASPNRISRLIQIIKSIKKYRPDVVQSSHFYTNIYAAIAGRIAGARSIGAVRSDLFSEIGADRIFGRWQAKLPEHLIANSSMAVQRAVSWGIKSNRIDLVKNVVNESNGGGRPAEFDKASSILFVGRLAKSKRPELFIRLARQLLSDLPDHGLVFRVVGDGPLRGEVEQLRDQLGLSETEIIFEGERSDLAEIYGNSDLLVLTSEYEGTPNVILEAMAYGVPVLATKVGGVPDLLNKENGVLVDPSDFDGLVREAKKLIVDPERRRKYSLNGKAYVRDHHSFDHLRKQLREIYQRQLGAAYAND